MQQIQQEGSLAQAEKWSDGKWKETGGPETRSPRSLWKSSRPAQEGLRELAGSLIIAATLGGTQRAHFHRTEAGGCVGTIALPPWSLPQQPQDRLPAHPLGHQQGLPGESPAPWADKKEAGYLPHSFLPIPLVPHLWKEAGASAVPWAERKLSQQEGIRSPQTSESSVVVLVVSINDAETFLKWLISPLFLFKWANFLHSQNKMESALLLRSSALGRCLVFSEKWTHLPRGTISGVLRRPLYPKSPLPRPQSASHLYTRIRNQHRSFERYLFFTSA